MQWHLTKLDLIKKKYLLLQLEASKSSIKDLLNDLLYETKGFKYQITDKALLKIYTSNGKFSSLFQFNNKNSDKIINLILTNFFKKFCTELITGLIKDLVGLLNQLSLSTLILELVDPLIRNYYIKFPVELRNPKKGLISIKKNDQNFLQCHIRHLNPFKKPSRKNFKAW